MGLAGNVAPISASNCCCCCCCCFARVQAGGVCGVVPVAVAMLECTEQAPAVLLEQARHRLGNFSVWWLPLHIHACGCGGAALMHNQLSAHWSLSSSCPAALVFVLCCKLWAPVSVA
jgi:hypothetical protein